MSHHLWGNDDPHDMDAGQRAHLTLNSASVMLGLREWWGTPDQCVDAVRAVAYMHSVVSVARLQDGSESGKLALQAAVAKYDEFVEARQDYGRQWVEVVGRRAAPGTRQEEQM